MPFRIERLNSVVINEENMFLNNTEHLKIHKYAFNQIACVITNLQFVM